MRAIFIFILLTVFSDDINRIAYINRLKKEAETAYKSESYQEAVKKYSVLVDSLGQREDKMLLNLSNAYFKANDTTNAKYLYNQLINTDNNSIKSLAYQQLGILANNQNKYEESLYYFKNSLKADPGNEDSRYNYELLKKLLENQQNQNQQNQQKDQNQDQQDQEQDQQKDQENDQKQEEQESQQNKQQQEEQQQQNEEQSQEEQQKSEEQKENENPPQPQNLEDMKISEEMAKKILEAMRNNEIQYLQQQRRKPTKPRDSGKPDW